MCTLKCFFSLFCKLVDYGELAGSPSVVHKLAKKSLHICDSYYSTGRSEKTLLRVARERMTSPILPNTLAEKNRQYEELGVQPKRTDFSHGRSASRSASSLLDIGALSA